MVGSRTGWDFAKDALAKMSRLKAHLTFPEPTDDSQYRFYGPSNMATATADGSTRDQHWSFGRDVAASYLTDEAAYLRYTGRNLPAWRQPYGLKSPEDMLADIEKWTELANRKDVADQTYGTWTRPLDEKPKPWKPSYHLDIPQLEWDYYPEEFWNIVKEEYWQKPFYIDDGDVRGAIQQHGDDFITWKLGGMGGAIHTGGLSWYPDRANGGLCGLSGGSLCAFWTEKGGIGILGRSRGSQGPTPDTWDNISSWMVNHVWGADMAGNRASSARYPNPISKTVIDKENALINITGTIGPLQDGGAIYERIFDIDKHRIQISVRTDNDPSTGLDDCLYETIPLWMGDGWGIEGNEQSKIVQYLVDGVWVGPWTGHAVSAAYAVSLQRNNHLILIEFEEPQRIHLGPVWSTGYQRTRERGVPLHIDIKETGSVRYTISGPYKHELVKV